MSQASLNPDRAEPVAGAGFEFPPLAVTTQPSLALSSETLHLTRSDFDQLGATPSASSSPLPWASSSSLTVPPPLSPHLLGAASASSWPPSRGSGSTAGTAAAIGPATHAQRASAPDDLGMNQPNQVKLDTSDCFLGRGTLFPVPDITTNHGLRIQ